MKFPLRDSNLKSFWDVLHQFIELLANRELIERDLMMVTTHGNTHVVLLLALSCWRSSQSSAQLLLSHGTHLFASPAALCSSSCHRPRSFVQAGVEVTNTPRWSRGCKTSEYTRCTESFWFLCYSETISRGWLCSHPDVKLLYSPVRSALS